MKARDLMDFVEQEDIHEDEMDYGRLAEMVENVNRSQRVASLLEENDKKTNSDLTCPLC
jgi:hypothetical protein